MTICVADFYLLTAAFATCKCTNEANLVPVELPSLPKQKCPLHHMSSKCPICMQQRPARSSSLGAIERHSVCTKFQSVAGYSQAHDLPLRLLPEVTGCCFRPCHLQSFNFSTHAVCRSTTTARDATGCRSTCLGQQNLHLFMIRDLGCCEHSAISTRLVPGHDLLNTVHADRQRPRIHDRTQRLYLHAL